MPKAQPQRGCPPSLYLMSPRNTIFDVQKFCIIGYMKSLAYSPDFIFLLYFIYGAAECGLKLSEQDARTHLKRSLVISLYLLSR